MLNIEHVAGAPRGYDALREDALTIEVDRGTGGRGGSLRSHPDEACRRARARSRGHRSAHTQARRPPRWRRRVNIGRDGPRRSLPRHRRLLAEPAARAARHARPARRRPPADRLWRGHPAAADELGRAGRARGAVHHPLSRGPRARPAGDAEDVRPAPARAPAHRARAARPRAPLQAARSGDRSGDLPDRARGARAERRARARRLPDRRIRRGSRRLVDRLRARGGPASGPVRSRPRPRAGRGVRARLRAPPARRGRERRASPIR